MEDKHIAYRFPDLPALKKAYMGFVREGGIFIPTTENSMHLGDSVTATLTLPKDDLSFSFTSEVIWITPNSTTSSKPAGIGLQCNTDEGEAFQKAVRELIGAMDDIADSDTM